MTYEQYWDGDPEMARFFRKADQLNLERRNRDMWLQGMYFYDALCSASPILRPFTKKGTKPLPYVEAPYPLTARAHESERERKEKKTFDKGKAYMAALMAQQSRKNDGKGDEP